MIGPGQRIGYHGLTYGFLVGEIAQRVTGKRFTDLLREELADQIDSESLAANLDAHESATLYLELLTMSDEELQQQLNA